MTTLNLANFIFLSNCLYWFSDLIEATNKPTVSEDMNSDYTLDHLILYGVQGHTGKREIASQSHSALS